MPVESLLMPTSSLLVASQVLKATAPSGFMTALGIQCIVLDAAKVACFENILQNVSLFYYGLCDECNIISLD